MAGVRTVAVLLGCALSIDSPAGAERIGAEVEEALARDGEVRVLVGLRTGVPPSASPDTRRAAAAAAQARVLRGLAPAEFRLAHRFTGVGALAGTATAPGLEALMAHPDVDRVALDAGGSGGLAMSVPHIRADVLHEDYGLTGAGVTVGVIDTGIASGHPDLAGAVVGEQCFCSTHGGCCPNGASVQSGPGAAADNHSHGTHVSGIITSDGNVAATGVAPGASIVAVKVIAADNTFCCISDVIAALDWIASERPDVRVVNLSLGTFATFAGHCDAIGFNPFVAAAVDALRANGVTVFASSMNDSLADALASPACLSGSVAVGATNLFDQVASFSNSGSALDLLAPGVGIVSSVAGGSASAFDGTSMASPHAAGVAALLLEWNPLLEADQIQAALVDGGVPVMDTRNALVRPRVDALGALEAVTCPNGVVDPHEECDDGNLVNGDGCDNNCTATACGNGVTTDGEECDEGDGNGVRGCCTAGCVRVDTDGDGTCDVDDPCPHVAGASPAHLLGPRLVLSYRANGPGGGDDVIRLANADFVTPIAFDPAVSHDVRVTLRQTAAGGELWQADLLAGALWRRPKPDRKRWIYVDRAKPTTTGVKRAVLRQLFADTNIYRLTLSGGDAEISASHAPLQHGVDQVQVLVEIESGGSGICLSQTLLHCQQPNPRKNVCR